MEATKFTEVGYVGRDVESIIGDPVDTAIAMVREREMIEFNIEPRKRLRSAFSTRCCRPREGMMTRTTITIPAVPKDAARRKLDEREIEIDVASPSIGMEIMAPPGMEELTSQIRGMFQNLNQQKPQTRRLKVAEAFKLLVDEEAANLIDDEEVKTAALDEVEQNAIVFIDEIDKVAKRSEYSGTDVSREGVQRDLLPLVEGCTVSTKYGMVRTDHILFIASGAFHLSNHRTWCPNFRAGCLSVLSWMPLPLTILNGF